MNYGNASTERETERQTSCFPIVVLLQWIRFLVSSAQRRLHCCRCRCCPPNSSTTNQRWCFRLSRNWGFLPSHRRSSPCECSIDSFALCSASAFRCCPRCLNSNPVPISIDWSAESFRFPTQNEQSTTTLSRIYATDGWTATTTTIRFDDSNWMCRLSSADRWSSSTDCSDKREDSVRRHSFGSSHFRRRISANRWSVTDRSVGCASACRRSHFAVRTNWSNTLCAFASWIRQSRRFSTNCMALQIRRLNWLALSTVATNWKMIESPWWQSSMIRFPVPDSIAMATVMASFGIWNGARGAINLISSDQTKVCFTSSEHFHRIVWPATNRQCRPTLTASHPTSTAMSMTCVPATLLSTN